MGHANCLQAKEVAMWTTRRRLALSVTAVLWAAIVLGADSQVLDNGCDVPEYAWGPKNIFVWIDVPAEVILGREFTLNVSVENRRSTALFHVEDLWLEDSFFGGFEFVDARPTPEEADTIAGELVLTYEMTIPAGARQEFNIRLRAVKLGVFIGDVDLWEAGDGDDDIASRVAQTEVKAAN
jgi:hypothetical protein